MGSSLGSSFPWMVKGWIGMSSSCSPSPLALGFWKGFCRVQEGQCGGSYDQIPILTWSFNVVPACRGFSTPSLSSCPSSNGSVSLSLGEWGFSEVWISLVFIFFRGAYLDALVGSFGVFFLLVELVEAKSSFSILLRIDFDSSNSPFSQKPS